VIRVKVQRVQHAKLSHALWQRNDPIIKEIELLEFEQAANRGRHCRELVVVEKEPFRLGKLPMPELTASRALPASESSVRFVSSKMSAGRDCNDMLLRSILLVVRAM